MVRLLLTSVVSYLTLLSIVYCLLSIVYCLLSIVYWYIICRGKKFKGQIFSIDTPSPKGYGKLRSRKFSAEEQEQALMSSSGSDVFVPTETEVLIISGPRERDLKKVKKLSEKFGEGTLIILINARLNAMRKDVVEANEELEDSKEKRMSNVVKSLQDSFENVFTYGPPVLRDREKKTVTGKAIEDKNILL